MRSFASPRRTFFLGLPRRGRPEEIEPWLLFQEVSAVIEQARTRLGHTSLLLHSSSPPPTRTSAASVVAAGALPVAEQCGWLEKRGETVIAGDATIAKRHVEQAIQLSDAAAKSHPRRMRINEAAAASVP